MLLQSSHSWSIYNLFGLQLDLFPNSTKPWATAPAFLSFKGLTQAYLVKTSITHNKYLTPRFLEDKDPLSAQSAVQILSLNPA